jgi:hypothetical protein
MFLRIICECVCELCIDIYACGVLLQAFGMYASVYGNCSIHCARTSPGAGRNNECRPPPRALFTFTFTAACRSEVSLEHITWAGCLALLRETRCSSLARSASYEARMLTLRHPRTQTRALLKWAWTGGLDFGKMSFLCAFYTLNEYKMDTKFYSVRLDGQNVQQAIAY